jgi:hypothetical protein
MNLRLLFAISALTMLTLSAAAEHAGIPQREYLGRTYLIYPVQVRGPVWYAGDGRVVAGDVAPQNRTAHTRHTERKY